ncbi:hypothetical protein [Escherichia coli]|uniref:hypothetical protein n=1 Tax=Escherichia coli TaxID=562 RepID=UPI00234EE861|nr:hypothetical protein [Escherichia coli]WCQ43550.1 hypothetical protein NL420_018375 [Escherichia coli]
MTSSSARNGEQWGTSGLIAPPWLFPVAAPEGLLPRFGAPWRRGFGPPPFGGGGGGGGGGGIT